MFICTHCQKSFETNRAAKTHERRSHKKPVDRLLTYSIAHELNVTRELAEINQIGLDLVFKSSTFRAWDVKTICLLLLKPSENLFSDFMAVKSTVKFTLRWFSILYGTETGALLYEQKKMQALSTNGSHKEYWIAKGYDEAEAKIKAKHEHTQKSKVATSKAIQKTSGTSDYTVRSKQYWLRRGLSQDEAHEKVRAIQATNTVVGYTSKFGNKGKTEFEKRNTIWATNLKAHMEARGLWRSDDEVDLLTRYRRCVIRLTERNYKTNLALINPNGLSRGHYTFELDHRYSISQGFRENVLPEILAHWTNLELLPSAKNNSKWSSCSINKEQLIENYMSDKKIH